MWLGMLYCTPDDEDEPMVMLFAWETGRPRPITFAGPAGDVAQTVRMLREVGAGASITEPRCDACGAQFDLPQLG